MKEKKQNEGVLSRIREELLADPNTRKEEVALEVFLAQARAIKKSVDTGPIASTIEQESLALKKIWEDAGMKRMQELGVLDGDGEIIPGQEAYLASVSIED